MSSESVRVFAPATVANVACGFDVLGFAVNQPGDEVIAQLTKKPGVRLTKISGDDGLLPTEPEKNTAGIAVQRMLEHLDSSAGFDIELHKKMPLSSGLGSSAASAVASVVAVNYLLGEPLNNLELLPFVIESERAACGSPHADNAAPALLGGFTLIRSYDPLEVLRLPVPDSLYCTLLHPDVEVLTGHARKLLPPDVPLRDAVTQWGNLGGFITALHCSDYELLGRSIQDVIVEPVRSKLIPAFTDLKQAALDSGALGCNISGSGPSMFALSTSESSANSIAEAMAQVCSDRGIKNQTYVSAINTVGPRIS